MSVKVKCTDVVAMICNSHGLSRGSNSKACAFPEIQTAIAKFSDLTVIIIMSFQVLGLSNIYQ